MPTGMAVSQANAILNAYCRSVVYADPASFNVKLHVGDPGASGVANAAGETTRKAATFSASSGGAITTSGSLVWTTVAASETITHVSFWDALVAGTFLGSGVLSAPAIVTAGSDLTIPAGGIDISLTPIAA